MTRTARHVLISGKVQGVWFRAWTEEQAGKLSLEGWVRNRRDGRVEAVIAGAPDAVQALLALFHEGPPLASVEAVEVGEAEVPAEPGFAQKPTF